MSELEQVKVNSSKPPRLAILVKRFIDIIWFLSVTVLCIFPVVILVIGLNIPAEIEDRHTDVYFHLGFKVLPPVLEETKMLSRELIQGSGDIKINNSKSALAWYLSSGISVVMGAIGLIALFYIRKIFANLAANDVFNKLNAGYIEKVGYVFIVWNVINPILVYFGGSIILSDIGIHSELIQLSPTLSLDLAGLLTGLAILVLGSVMKEASILHEEQSLTI